MQPKPPQLRPIQIIHEPDIRRRHDLRTQLSIIRDRVRGVIELRPVEIGRIGEEDEVCLPSQSTKHERSISHVFIFTQTRGWEKLGIWMRENPGI